MLASPVIFLPGIMGSSLRDEYTVTPESVWSVGRAAVKSYDRITLHPDNLRYELNEPARVVKDQVFTMFYEEIIEELRYNLAQSPEQPVPVFPFAYDWRQPLVEIQRQLADFIEEVIERTSLLRHYNAAGYTAKTGKVNLVGHSMGGLLIAGYIKGKGMDRVNKVATLASPFRGSLEAVAKTAIGVGGFSFGSGASREREAARVTPALYHLLPSFTNAVRADAGLEKDIFLPAAWQPGILETIALFVTRHGLSVTDPGDQATKILGEMLDQAWKHRSSMEKLKLADPKRWLCVVGVDGETRLGMQIRADANGKPRFELEEPVNEWNKAGGDRTKTGDNTVPFLGARCAFIPEEQVVCVTPGDFGFFEFKDKLINQLGFHSAIPNMNFAQRLVINHLLDRPNPKGGSPSPNVTPASWNPPVAGLKV